MTEEIKEEVGYNCKFIKDMNDNNTEIVMINYKTLMAILDKYNNESYIKINNEKECYCVERYNTEKEYEKYKKAWEELKTKHQKVNQEEIETFGKMLNSCLAEVTLNLMQEIEKKNGIGDK